LRAWHAYAALAEKDFPPRRLKFTSGLWRSKNPAQRVNPLVLQAFSGTPPASMRDVAQRYGELLSDVDKAWRDALKTAATNHTTPPTTLDPNQEPSGRSFMPRFTRQRPARCERGHRMVFSTRNPGRTGQAPRADRQVDHRSPGAPPHALILADRAAPRNARVFIRGNPANKGDEVPRQFLEVLSGPNRRPFQRGSGRLELARAIASRDKSSHGARDGQSRLAPSFWLGLVRTPSDFGTRCEPPSHPELLDWLAARFVDSGWSIKSVHRLIMLSSVYQQGSDFESVLPDASLRRLAPARAWRRHRSRRQHHQSEGCRSR